MLTSPSFVLMDVEDMYTLEFRVTAVSELGQGPPSPAIAANFTAGKDGGLDHSVKTRKCIPQIAS
jgi:hypothetical protein